MELKETDPSRKERLSGEQKVWLWVSCFTKALKPAVLYLLVPSLLLTAGKMFRRTDLTTAEFIRVSGNFYYAAGTLATLWLLYRLARRRGNSLFEEVSLSVKTISVKKLLSVSAAGLGVGFVLSVFLTLITSAGLPLNSYREISMGAFQGRDLPLLFLTVGFTAPLVEEIIFRGYMYRQLKNCWQKRTAAYISAAVFALFHVSLIWMCYAFFIALFLTYIAEKEKNIIFSAGFHMGINLSSVILWGVAEWTGNSLFWG